jgi:hypothetical protein
MIYRLDLKRPRNNKVNIVTKDNRPFDRLKGSALTRRISSIFSSISEARTGLLIQFFSLLFTPTLFSTIMKYIYIQYSPGRMSYNQ